MDSVTETKTRPGDLDVPDTFGQFWKILDSLYNLEKSLTVWDHIGQFGTNLDHL